MSMPIEHLEIARDCLRLYKPEHIDAIKDTDCLCRIGSHCPSEALERTGHYRTWDDAYHALEVEIQDYFIEETRGEVGGTACWCGYCPHLVADVIDKHIQRRLADGTESEGD